MNKNLKLNQRSAGILLHPTSLTGPHGSGDLGPEAYNFIDFLHDAGQRWWQMLPISPIGAGDSPYSSYSAFAGSPLLISLHRLADDGLLTRADLKPTRGLSEKRVNYGQVINFRLTRLRRAFHAFDSDGGPANGEYRDFCREQCHWLDDFALFSALKWKHDGVEWLKWKPGPRQARRQDLQRARKSLARDIEFERFVQYQFDRQWQALRAYANQRRVGLIGDIPIFVSHDSADVWSHRNLFQLDDQGRATHLTGVPPDAFSDDGQFWGHPHYRWEEHQRTQFAWWIDRFRQMFRLFDAVRIDHFLGFYRAWSVPAGSKTARNGRWILTPGLELFLALQEKLGQAQIIAEDIGAVTVGAFALRDRFGFPGMRLLQNAFGDWEGDPYNLPHRYERNCVVYPGTHDNETTVEWFDRLKRAANKRRRTHNGISEFERVQRYLGTDGREIHWDVLRVVYQSIADLVITPLQNPLGLGKEARMNIPATPTGNWHWRIPPGSLHKRIAERLRALAAATERCDPALNVPPDQKLSKAKNTRNGRSNGNRRRKNATTT